jgi:hypothetical protein
MDNGGIQVRGARRAGNTVNVNGESGVACASRGMSQNENWKEVEILVDVV